MDLLIVLSIITAVTSLVAAITSLLSIFQNKRIEKLQADLAKAEKRNTQVTNELYKVYLNVRELLDIEKELSEELEKGKITIRRGHNTDRYIEPKRVANRIKELEQEKK